MSYYDRDAAYKALSGDNPDVQAIIGKLSPDDCAQLLQRLGREVTPLKARLQTLEKAMLEASRKAGQKESVDQALTD